MAGRAGAGVPSSPESDEDESLFERVLNAAIACRTA
jgi:hypothetical protein